jgi:alpha-tubulin suppressor-like RCC1 family protein
MNPLIHAVAPFLRRALSGALLLGLAPHVLAGTTHGTPYSWALTDPMALPADATNIIALDASLLGPIALRADGTVLTWDGSPPPPPGLSNVVAIAAGDVFHLALTADGRPVAWGGFHVEGLAITTPPVWLTNVVGISAGYSHSVALTSDGYLIP